MSHVGRGLRFRSTWADRQALIEQLRQLGDGPDCFVFPWGTRDKRGYGRISVNYKRLPASRWVYMELYGPIPEGMGVLHSCDNPPCVRPSHLWLGTQKDNLRDMRGKGRAGHPSKLGIPEVTVILRLAAIGTPFEAIEREMGMSPRHLKRIISGSRWHDAVETDMWLGAERPWRVRRISHVWA